MKKTWILTVFILFLMILFGCSDMGTETEVSELPLMEIDDGQGDIKAGELTAGEWKDLDAFDFYLSLFEENNEEVMPFYPYKEHPYFQLRHLIEVEVTYQDQKVPFARVQLQDDDLNMYGEGITDMFGKVYFFQTDDILEDITEIHISIDDDTFIYEGAIEQETNIILDQLLIMPSTNIIDLMVVFDTTGSMGDELKYLQKEIEDVILRLKTDLEDVEIRLAFLFYRDITDDYITRCTNFSTDIEAQLESFSLEIASGGGDFPEASDRALDEAMRKDWTEGNSTKILLHVADAPPHNDPDSMMMFKHAIMEAANKGIRIIPIASSGIDKETEFLMRAEAMLTGGTYVFLTNHSGIGNEKIIPSVGTFVVEYLNDLLVRLIKTYHTGEIFDKIPYDQRQS